MSNLIVKCVKCGKTYKVRDVQDAFRCCGLLQGISEQTIVVIGIPRRKIDNLESPKNTPKNKNLVSQNPKFIFKKLEVENA